ncbi:hypothetical protein FWH13_00390 [Candidatus Saccharibacteria bacterium]|nr:hypothetical protein [Candidatus Saccharibacteria bacterium]
MRAVLDRDRTMFCLDSRRKMLFMLRMDKRPRMAVVPMILQLVPLPPKRTKTMPKKALMENRVMVAMRRKRLIF